MLALVWLVVAVGLFLFKDHGQPTGSFPIPLSGLALLVMVYNLVRWWSWRSVRRTSPALQVPRRRPLRRPGDDAVPAPTFDFRDRPEGEPDKRS